MQLSLTLLLRRRFLPLFVTQALGAFNDHLFKTAMVMLVTYRVFSDEHREAAFNALANGLYILPFFLFSALAGQLADCRDKAMVIRWVKSIEIAIMLVGAAGLLFHSVTLLLFALFAMGMHSTFFGPIKYALLPQHLRPDEVLGGTGLIEAGTYTAVLIGILVGGIIPPAAAAALVLAIALIGRLTSRHVPAAPPVVEGRPLDFHIVRASIRLVSETLHVPRLLLAVLAISVFWMQAAILGTLFVPLVKNVLEADQSVATLFLAVFSIGVAIGSLAINRLLGGAVSARYAPAAALVMGLFLLDLHQVAAGWHAPDDMTGVSAFLAMPKAPHMLIDLLGVAIFGGMFVVPLYAFLTTTVDKLHTARTVAANNIVNSGAMVIGACLFAGLLRLGVPVADTLLVVAAGSLAAALLAWRLHRACAAALSSA
ncbi:MFS transporter [Sphingomonas morindae]|uniref:MFS transporter n=1 Tax=Sphingomonas morindae TaxID=1541170 RepID=A0ABY4XCQ0_9SPHN|nr:MFS transporter [Sphingomonas morindae]USI74526.1 MFS transporter [Sphingomonas morindae]